MALSQNLTEPGKTWVAPAATVAVSVRAVPWASVVAEAVSAVVVVVEACAASGASSRKRNARRRWMGSNTKISSACGKRTRGGVQ